LSDSAIHSKRKILNDPVYGFITLNDPVVYRLIEHRWFQRLRRIKQLGMSHLVYPGALHTRFHHALGAMHLMSLAIASLRDKDVEISADEARGALVAILLHDIGHGPFSHSLEYTLVRNVKHETLSGLFMERLNKEFGGELTTGIDIFYNRHPKYFLHQLVSSQLDMDRLDYLSRDSFYTGVSEGVVSNQRIIKMLHVHHGKLVVEEKGIYSIEKFIVARRLMYWQVYLHKAVVAGEKLLIHILRRARELAGMDYPLFASPALKRFLNHEVSREAFHSDPTWLEQFARLDDFDIMGAIKVWQDHPDPVLSALCAQLVNRRLPAVLVSRDPFDPERVEAFRQMTLKLPGINAENLSYFFEEDTITNHAYVRDKERIMMLMKTGELVDLADASDNHSLRSQTESVTKHVLYLPKEVTSAGAAH
jgi:HD superfamily phosphohydrolase